jgi:hypothetical protein
LGGCREAAPASSRGGPLPSPWPRHSLDSALVTAPLCRRAATKHGLSSPCRTQQRRGHRYLVYPSNRGHPIDYLDPRCVNYLDHSHCAVSKTVVVDSRPHAYRNRACLSHFLGVLVPVGLILSRRGEVSDREARWRHSGPRAPRGPLNAASRTLSPHDSGPVLHEESRSIFS